MLRTVQATAGANAVEAPLLVRDEDCPASNGAFFERRNPITGDVASRASAATLDDVSAAVSAAAAAFPAWSRLGPDERRIRLLAAAAILEDRRVAFTNAMQAETGATADWARFNVEFGASMLREAAALTTQITGEILPSDKPGMTAMVIRQPAGVVLGLAPWNAPVALAVRAAAAPLACGNTIVLKTSEICPRTHRLVGEVLRDAGLGRGVVNIISSAPDDTARTVEALIAHPAVRRINFTGSTRAGQAVAEMAARHLKPVLLELSSKAPLIVLDDADIEEAVKAAVYGCFWNQGQICMSTGLIVVDGAIADAFAERLAQRAAALLAGDPRSGKAPLGSLVSAEAAARVESLVRDAIEKGAQVLTGGRRHGALVDAMVLDHITPVMRIYSEEIFGPVAVLVRVRGAEEAIRVTNESRYGLSSAVFGRDLTRAMDVAQCIEAGICHINGPTVHDEAHMPFGGMKASGYGRFGGKAAIHEFTELRWITISCRPSEYPI